ncbi:uncharacterized protein LOC143216196 [Lasioglossum baleicum]|uniref:uncharacterized protein LOC143216196 n=1 Tax=Lasioglossum baleicum TaxID=434251 RepID=UPI003FCC98E3
MLNEYNLNECKSTKSPIELGIKLSRSDCPSTELEQEEMRNVPYRRLIGSLMYIDILYMTSKLAQFVSNPGNNEVEVFSDADWAADVDDRHSYNGMVVFLGGNAISWKSNKQKSISMSTMEAEYVALANAVKEIISMDMMYDEMRNSLSVELPYTVSCTAIKQPTVVQLRAIYF